MWWIALAAIAAAPDPAAHMAQSLPRQAQAVVRIVNPARVELGRGATGRDDLNVPARSTHFRDADGSVRPAKLVEFS